MSAATANEPFVFSPSANLPTGGADVVDDMRREITEIIREVAGAVRGSRNRGEFYAFFADRMLRAMAAEGVVIWQRDAEAKMLAYQCVHRLGRITDQAIPSESIAAHQRLLVEVGRDASPVVVPPTPGAIDADVPANPTAVPTALVPIRLVSTAEESEIEPGCEVILQVFLESGGGIATQRGYLRFVAQMADLAGEFLRGDQLRVMGRFQSMSSRIDWVTTQIHQSTDQPKLLDFIVDTAADLFGFDRVGLVKIDGSPSKPKARLMAVSHVHTIDQKSPAAEQLRSVATAQLDRDGCRWFDSQPLRPSPMASGTPIVAPTTDATMSSISPPLVVRAIAAGLDIPGRPSSFRLIGMQTSDAIPVSPEARQPWSRLCTHAALRDRKS